MECPACAAVIPDDSEFCSSCGVAVSDPGRRPHAVMSGPDLLARLQEVVGGRYDVLRLLGTGGMGAVYLARDRALDRLVAIKVLAPEFARAVAYVGRFEREARTAAKLDHPNIVPIYTVDSSEGLYYFVMKYVAGRTLEVVIEEGPVAIPFAQRVLWEAGRALGHAHTRGIVHRDVKPSNIMLDEDGHVLITDFGISKHVEATTQLTGTGHIVGTPGYMSPEQAKGMKVDGRSDQYALAVVGYHILTGRLPFQASSTHGLIYQHLTEDPLPIRELREEILPFMATAIHRGMAKDSEQRFGTMEEFATALWPEQPLAPPPSPPKLAAELAAMPTEISGKEPRSTSRGPWSPRRVWTSIAGAAAVVIASAGLYAALSTGRGTDTSTAQPTPAADSLATNASAMPPAPADTPGAARSRSQETSRGAEQRTGPGRAEPAGPAVTAPPAPNVGYLTIDAIPYGMVSVDGVDVGLTPISAHPLAPGRYVVRVSREGYHVWSDTLVITARNTARYRVQLLPERP